jgi:hypothetical protein
MRKHKGNFGLGYNIDYDTGRAIQPMIQNSQIESHKKNTGHRDINKSRVGGLRYDFLQVQCKKYLAFLSMQQLQRQSLQRQEAVE